MPSISKKTVKASSSSSNSNSSSDDCPDVRRGPWTLHEDSLLLDYISIHGEGRWNLLSKRAGLKRTGKSCRLRWLNYLKPDIKRGNFSPLEQLLILDLHSVWGNRWSKIAQQLPGRTDNEIKNYWRTRVQTQAKHLNVDANSTAFKEIIRTLWMPRLLQSIQYSTSSSPQQSINVSQLDQLRQDQTFADANCHSTSSAHVTNYSNCFEGYYVDTGSCCNVETMSGVPLGFGSHVGDGHVADVECAGFDFGESLWSMDEFMTF